MITRLALRNWRVYESVDLNLDPGTTFVVARNGIGKTSLIEGAKWAIFGEAGGRPQEAVRVGASSASATVDMTLPDGRVLTITRELPKKLARTRAAPVSATLDGKALTPEEADTAVRNALGGDPTFLARLTMLKGTDHLDAAPDLNLREHLGRFFAVEGLQEMLDELVVRAKEIEDRIKQVKEIVGVSPSQLKALRADRDRTLQLADEAEAAHRRVQETVRINAELKRKAEAFGAWERDNQKRTADLAEIAKRVTSLAEKPVGSEQIDSSLDALEIDSTEALESIRRQRGGLEGRIDAVSSALQELETATGTCPVCRRPLSEEDANTARLTHESELTRMRQELDELDESSLVERLRAIRELRKEVDRLSKVPEPPGEPGISLEEVEIRLSTAKHEAEALSDQLIERKSEALAASNALEQAESDLRSSEALESEFRSLGFVTATKRAVSATIDGLLADIIEPLEREIAWKWKRLFGDRGSLKLSEQGILSREVGGEALNFASFSTGEKVGAQLLLRLLVLQTATRASFCWVDEPLEHLDPETRRLMASLIATLTETTRLDQMLVTTYEEPLARRLASRRSGQVGIVYVRPEADITAW